ncbi:MAG: class I SAM-dependent methyltransferase [Stenotrophobium sp.]
MNLYDQYILPHLIDFACGLGPVQRQRAKVVPLAAGKVLEIGVGTGLNLPFYDKSRVTNLTALDPAVQMNAKAQRRMRDAGLDVEMLMLSAEQIPMPDASFDTVVCTFTLCTIPDPGAALREMRRVLKPDGRLLYCEHGLAPDAAVRRWQERVNPLWRPLAGGCNLDRDIPRLLESTGFRIETLERMYLPGPRIFTYNYWGVATPLPG